MIPTATVPARSTVRMTPHTLDIMVYRPPQVRVGDTVPVVLRFRESGTMRVEARVVRPGN